MATPGARRTIPHWGLAEKSHLGVGLFIAENNLGRNWYFWCAWVGRMEVDLRE